MEGLRIRRYIPPDRTHLVPRLAPVLARTYPGGATWLGSRLDEVEAGTARCTVASVGRSLCGVAIETPKERGRLKLSTLWVDAAWQGHGIGHSLMIELHQRWITARTERVNLTAEAGIAGRLAPFLREFGFRVVCIDRDRYGEGRHEVVFEWTAGQALDIAAHGTCETAVTAGLTHRR